MRSRQVPFSWQLENPDSLLVVACFTSLQVMLCTNLPQGWPLKTHAQHLKIFLRVISGHPSYSMCYKYCHFLWWHAHMHTQAHQVKTASLLLLATICLLPVWQNQNIYRQMGKLHWCIWLSRILIVHLQCSWLVSNGTTVANNCNYGNSLNPTQLFNEAPTKRQQERRTRARRWKSRRR